MLHCVSGVHHDLHATKMRNVLHISAHIIEMPTDLYKSLDIVGMYLCGLVHCIQSLYGSEAKCETWNKISTGNLIATEQQVGNENL